MRTRVGHCKRHDCDVYIGRPTKWGNRWTHKQGTQAQYVVASPQEAVRRYREWILTQPQLLAELRTLKGKLLGCWCKRSIGDSTPCHGDVLAELADQL